MSGKDLQGDQAVVSVSVAVDQETAFAIFTEEIDQWWRRGARFRVAGAKRGIIHLEPRAGGRLFESFDTDAEPTVVQTGTITVWDPPRRLAFDWRGANFAPHERTEVEVTFEGNDARTLVTVVHRGWSSIRSDHPARHGLDVVAFLGMNGMWWGDQMASLRTLIASRS